MRVLAARVQHCMRVLAARVQHCMRVLACASVCRLLKYLVHQVVHGAWRMAVCVLVLADLMAKVLSNEAPRGTSAR